MVRTCYICNDTIYRDKIDSMILEGRRISEIHNWLKDKDSVITYRMLYNHSKNHVKGKKTKDLRKKAIEIELSASLDTVQTLRNNLEIVNEKINEKLYSDELDPKEELVLLKFLNEARQITNEIRSWMKQLDYTPRDWETFETRVMYAIGPFSIEHKKKFLSRWESCEGLTIEEIESRMREEEQKNKPVIYTG